MSSSGAVISQSVKKTKDRFPRSKHSHTDDKFPRDFIQLDPKFSFVGKRENGTNISISSVLEELQKKYNGIYNFYYVDVEKQMNLFQRFSLQGVPQILFFKDGAYQGKLAGHVIDEKVEEKIAEVFEA